MHNFHRIVMTVMSLMLGALAMTQATVQAADSAAWGPPVPIQAAFAPALYPERSLGNPAAKVTVYEYASLTCPHCARWEANVFPSIKAAYIDTGKVRYVYRDYPLDQLSYSVAIISRCVPEKNYFTFLEGLFKTQDKWATSDVPMTQVKQLAALVGLSGEGVDACLKNTALTDQMEVVRKQAEDSLGVDSTPTFIVAGFKKSGEISVADFSKELDAALAAAP